MQILMRHSEPFVCHPERSEGSQGKLREGSREILRQKTPQDDAKKLRDFLIAVLLFLFLFPAICPSIVLALGEKPPREIEHEEREEKAEKALEALRQAYSARSLSEVFEGVSDDYRRGWTDFRSDLSEQLTGVGSSDLHFVLNRTLVEGDKIALQVHWQKRTMASKTGKVEISEGDAEFIFQTAPDGKPLLIDIRGQSPF